MYSFIRPLLFFLFSFFHFSQFFPLFQNFSKYKYILVHFQQIYSSKRVNKLYQNRHLINSHNFIFELDESIFLYNNEQSDIFLEEKTIFTLPIFILKLFFFCIIIFSLSAIFFFNNLIFGDDKGLEPKHLH